MFGLGPKVWSFLNFIIPLVFSFFCFSKFIFVYIFLFLLTIFFLLCIKYSNERQIIFFLLQEIISFSFLVFVYFLRANKIILLLLLTKIGVVPFYFWVLKILKEINIKEIIIFFSVFKIIPVWLLFCFFGLNWIFVMFVFFIINCYLIFFSFSFKPLFIFSSSLHSFWIFLLRGINKTLRVFYFMLYVLFIITLLRLTSKTFSIGRLFFIVLIRCPPLLVFLLKWITLFYLLVFVKTYLIVWLVLSLLTLFCYFRFIQFNKKNDFLYNFSLIRFFPFFFIL